MYVVIGISEPSRVDLANAVCARIYDRMRRIVRLHPTTCCCLILYVRFYVENVLVTSKKRACAKTISYDAVVFVVVIPFIPSC